MQPYPGPYPYGGYPQAYPGVPYGPAHGLPRPVAVAQVGQTPFGVALVEVTAPANGPAAASLVAGIASLVVSTVVTWFAVAGAQAGWGAKVAGAFAVLSALLCAAAVGLSRAGRRRIRTSPVWSQARGHGVAVAGLVCGLLGLAVTAVVMVVALLGVA